ncbi:hypothetical protein T310_5849, partial [Rasamsonia emersonii CBS 393.64]
QAINARPGRARIAMRQAFFEQNGKLPIVQARHNTILLSVSCFFLHCYEGNPLSATLLSVSCDWSDLLTQHPHINMIGSVNRTGTRSGNISKEHRAIPGHMFTVA